VRDDGAGCVQMEVEEVEYRLTFKGAKDDWDEALKRKRADMLRARRGA
jgi:hypothetical protein